MSLDRKANSQEPVRVYRRHTLVIAASSCPSGPPQERLLRRGRGSWLSDCDNGSGCGAYIVSRTLTQKLKGVQGVSMRAER